MSTNVYPDFQPITTPRAFQEFIQSPPTFEQALAFLRRKNGEHLTESIVREWYNYMESCCWSDQRGNAYRNWPRAFYIWKIRRAKYAALDAAAEARRARAFRGRPPLRAENYIRATDAEIQRFTEEII